MNYEDNKMKVEQTENIKIQPKDQHKTLFERFGSGVHLIQTRKGKHHLMIICNIGVDVLFISHFDNNVTYIRGTYANFDNNYDYVKKLSDDELIVRVKNE